MSGFADQYLCAFRQTPAEMQLHQVAESYVNKTEAYDRTVCTGPIINGSIQPATQRERALINRHAIALLTRLVEAHSHLFCRRELLREIGRVDHQGASA